MKRILLNAFFTFVAVSIAVSSYAFTNVSVIVPKATIVNPAWPAQLKNAPEVQALSPEMIKMGMNEFLSLTPAKYKKLTGQKLGLKKSMELKAAQKLLKNNMAAGEKISKGLYILLAILGLGWVALGILSDWSGNDWWVNLILTLLCWLPGLIHALIKMKDYYK